MVGKEYDPDLNLLAFNDHGIFTLEELKELFPVVKPLTSVIHLNIRSLNQHFSELCNLIDSTPLLRDMALALCKSRRLHNSRIRACHR